VEPLQRLAREAKERYLWTLELKRRGLTAMSVLRKTMQEMIGEADR
jgi:hypothetical protein